ncbi:proline-rich extensin-like protein EPR1 [Rhopalosiphum maidis]|uniref:proline-rich extensin-like protein EPR1 n=1 Tax=Rhopalosiphum maidis TaxID=43146 RepID=UPI000EFFA52C|nr:proline-rich extensin-like protein EPR1 [Rhopalosiphum maidis]
MSRLGQMSLVLLAVAVCHVYGQVPSSTPCSLSFYRYLFNLPGEQIRPNVPEGTYMFGKRVGPPTPEGQASDVKPSVLQAPQYLPPVPTTTTTTTTTTLRPSTSAPIYIPPAPQNNYYPSESINTVSVLQPAKPTCDHPEHQHVVDTGLLPPYPTAKFQPQPTFKPQPTFQPQPTFFVPRFVAPPQPQVPVAISDNEIFAEQRKPVTVHRFAVPTPSPQFLRPYTAPAPSAAPAENCDKHVHVTSTTTTTTTTTPEPSTETLVETRQNEISIAPEAKHPADCGHKQHNVVIESVGVPSTDYGVVSAPAPAPSAGYSYDRPSEPLAYPSNGYNYPKGSPSFEYPGAFSAQATALFESESPKSSAGGTEDGDLVILKV